MNAHICPKECPNRNAVCHIDCPEHLIYREEVELERKKRNHETAVKNYQAEQTLKAVDIRNTHKNWKRRKKQR